MLTLKQVSGENFGQNKSIILLSKDWQSEGHFWSLESLIETSRKSNCTAWLLEDALGESCGITIIQEVDTFASLLFTYITRQKRRNGYGKFMLSKILIELKSPPNQMHSIELEVSEHNVSAVKLYESLGFKPVRRRGSYYKDGSDALVMLFCF
jgi:ribosomal protein S18 acetylase RimI-like enzyme